MDLVAWLQQEAGWLTPLMRLVTHLGDEEIYLLGFPLLYWCVHRRAGLRVGVLLLLSAGLNGVLKLALASPRPYWLSDGVLAGVAEPSFGAPSGHAQNGVAVWGVLADQVGRRWAWVAAGALAFLLGVSRVHLGVHFAGDVLAGWAVGALLLAAFLRLEPPALAALARLSPAARAVAAVAAGLVLAALGALALALWGGGELPAQWRVLTSGDAGLDPRTLRAVVTPAGALAGLGAGAVLLHTRGGFAVPAEAWRVALRYPLGLAGVVLLWQGLGALLPGGDELAGTAARFVRYALVGTWISGLAPLLFVRLGLARPAERATPAR